MNDICASIQNRIVSILLNKLKKAAAETGVTNICLAGGVSANSGLRKAFTELGQKMHWQTFIPAFEYCTDNAAMIAITGYYKFLEEDFAAVEYKPQLQELNGNHELKTITLILKFLIRVISDLKFVL